MADRSTSTDHPQTIKNEPDARDVSGSGGALFTEQQERAQDHAGDEGEIGQPPAPLGDTQSTLDDDDAEAIRRHAHGARSMGDAIGSSAGRDIGSGTPGDSGDLGGGDPQKVG